MGISEDLEGAIDIVDLVGRYASLKKAGANYKATCPFPGHSEKTPSFIVSPSKQLAYCFGCHKGGGAIKFIMDIENCEYKDAIEILGAYTGIKVNTNFNQEKFEKKKSLYSLYRDATNYYKEALKKNIEIKKYLFDRGLNDEIIRDFNLGYSDSGIELYSYLKNKGYSDEQIEESNIFIDIKLKKDKFINRIMFPIQNTRGDFVAFAGRIHGKGEPKYLNSPASNFYDKSQILYNLFNARTSITKQDYIIICEGYMDVIALNKGGFLNVVAVSGTAMTDKHLVMIKRLTKKVYLCFDGDSAGEKATKLALEKMKNEGLEVKIIMLPSGKDPDDIISSGKDFQEYIDKAQTPIGFYIKKSKIDNNSIEEKRKLLGELLGIVKGFSDSIEKDFYLKEIAKILEINENLVYDSYNRIRYKSKLSDDNKNSNIKEVLSSSDLIIAYIVNNENYINIVKEKILFYEQISNDLKSILENGIKVIDSFELTKKDKYKALGLKLETENEFSSSEHLEQELLKAINGLNRDLYKKESDKLKSLINKGEQNALIKYSQLVITAKKHGLK